MKRFSITLASLLTALVLSVYIVAAQTCGPAWEAARRVIDSQCTPSIVNDSVCYGYPTLAVQPAHSGFVDSGSIVSVFDLQSVQALPSATDMGGVAWFKVNTATALPGVVTGQAVVFIIFGDSSVSGIQNYGGNVSMTAPGVCKAQIRPGSTTFGGSYLRALPDPLFQIECRNGNCPDKDNLLKLIREGVWFDVLAIRQAPRDTILARDSYVTGWISTDSRYLDLSQCNLAALPTISDSDLVNGLNTTSDIQALSAFYLVNTGTGMQCQDVPPGGVIVHDPTHQRIRFNVNQATIEMASTVFLRGDSAGTGVTVMVLQGSSTVTKGGVSVSAGAGQVIDALGATPVLASSAGIGNWCQQLSQITASIFPGVPVERTDYCASLVTSGVCPGSLPPRLTIGGQGHIAQRFSALRSAPGGTVIQEVLAPAGFTVLEGPICANDTLAYFRIDYGNGLNGWAVESEINSTVGQNVYWLQPGGLPTTVEDCSDSIDQRLFVGDVGQIAAEFSDLYTSPGGTLIQTVLSPALFDVIGGPVCVGGLRYLQIAYRNGLVGWAVESEIPADDVGWDGYYLELAPRID